jgi:serine/threonine protein kinase
MTQTDHNQLPLGISLHEYVIEAVLGMGAFGITYKATDTNLGVAVAIKEYLPESCARRAGDNQVAVLSDDVREMYEWGRDRFLDEVKILAKFRHPNIVRVNRYFMANDTAYFVMDFEDGESLQSLLSRTADPLDEARIKNICHQVLSGLHAVHEQKYLHRDIKPGNIYLRKDGSAALIDFGAARLEMAGEEDATALVTPGYAPVEQYVADGKQGPWSDLYAIGATIYRCLTRKTPVSSIARMKKLEEEGVDPCPPLSKQEPQLGSREFLETVDWMMAIVPEDRPQSVQEVLDAWAGKKRRPQAAAKSFTYVPRQARKTYKILIAGPVGVGKSTAIHTISDSGMLAREAFATDSVQERKEQTTVAMDYGSLDISDNERILLYGVPGQERFNFMWHILQKEAIGLVLLIDNGRRNPLGDLDFFLQSFDAFINKTGIVIGINRTEQYPRPSIFDYHFHLQSKQQPWNVHPPIMEVDPRNHEEMRKLVLSLLCHLDPGVEEIDV